MPGIRVASEIVGNGAPVRVDIAAASYMNGAGTPPAAYLQAGDIVCRTTYSGGGSPPSSNSQPVGRMLLAADKTAHYQAGGSSAGIYGICAGDIATNSTGVAQPLVTAYPGAVPYPYSMGGLVAPDPVTGRNYIPTFIIDGATVFAGRLDTTNTALTYAQCLALIGSAAGILISGNAISAVGVTAGVSYYRVQGQNDSNLGASDKILLITGFNTADPVYQATVAQGLGISQNVQGFEVYFQVQAAFRQLQSGVSYTAQ